MKDLRSWVRIIILLGLIVLDPLPSRSQDVKPSTGTDENVAATSQVEPTSRIQPAESQPVVQHKKKGFVTVAVIGASPPKVAADTEPQKMVTQVSTADECKDRTLAKVCPEQRQSRS